MKQRFSSFNEADIHFEKISSFNEAEIRFNPMGTGGLFRPRVIKTLAMLSCDMLQ